MHMITRYRAMPSLVVAAALTLTGCSALGQTKQEQGKAASGPITIGHLTPLSGFLGQQGSQDLAGVKFAVGEINGSGGLLGRQVKLISRDDVDPGVAVHNATQLVETSHVDALFGEISSASGLAIAGIADRSKTVYVNTGWNSNQGRGKECSPYVFHTDGDNTMYVSTVGLSVTKNVKANNYYILSADYAFGQDLRNETKLLLSSVKGTKVVGDVLVPTGTSDYTTYIRRLQAAKPDTVFLNLAGADQTTFLKQYTQEYGAPYNVTGGVMDTIQFWAAGRKNITGVWPATYYHMLDTPKNKVFVTSWRKAHGNVPPDNQAWQSYVGVKVWADGVKKAGTVDDQKVVEALRSGMEFDVLKKRPAVFRKLDNQLMYDMEAVKVKASGESAEDKYDVFDIVESVPGVGKDLEAIQIPADRSGCNMGK